MFNIEFNYNPETKVTIGKLWTQEFGYLIAASKPLPQDFEKADFFTGQKYVKMKISIKRLHKEKQKARIELDAFIQYYNSLMQVPRTLNNIYLIKAIQEELGRKESVWRFLKDTESKMIQDYLKESGKIK